MFGLIASLFAFGWISAQGAANEKVFAQLNKQLAQQAMRVVEVETSEPLTDEDVRVLAPHWRSSTPTRGRGADKDSNGPRRHITQPHEQGLGRSAVGDGVRSTGAS